MTAESGRSERYLLLDTDVLLVESRQLTESSRSSAMVPLEFGNHPAGIDAIFRVVRSRRRAKLAQTSRWSHSQ